jgi:hypothetical protein
MGWAILCTARRGRDIGIDKLALVDRSKSRRWWWTSDDSSLILNYRLKTAADFACRRLTRNATEVVSYVDAVRIIDSQDNDIIMHEANVEAEMGWDAHKES